jgi:hypothetical protein
MRAPHGQTLASILQSSNSVDVCLFFRTIPFRGTPARRQEEEATMAAATRFFFYSGMRGKESFVLSCFVFALFWLVLAPGGGAGEVGCLISRYFKPGDEDLGLYICHDREAVVCNMKKQNKVDNTTNSGGPRKVV